MVLPPRGNDPEGPATFYLLRHGSWREVPASTSPLIGIKAFSRAVNDLLSAVMQKIAQDQAAGADQTNGAQVTLKLKSQMWWKNLVPEPIRQALAEACLDAELAHTVPQLLVNAHPSLEWMPWELLHDGTDYLGLRFQVARLPIVSAVGEEPVDLRRVRQVVNLLGTQILADVKQDVYQCWASTFDAFQSLGVKSRRRPPDDLSAGWPTLFDLDDQADADIIHITAHGGVNDRGLQYLALDRDDILTNSVDEDVAGNLAFGVPGPLVFGNACGSLSTNQSSGGGATIAKGLGVTFFDHGASAYVGSMAPLGTETAIRFAAAFYTFLLKDGLCVGEALRQAKVTQAAMHQPDPSYLFYCLYGLPGTRFVPDDTVLVAEQPSPSSVAAKGE